MHIPSAYAGILKRQGDSDMANFVLKNIEDIDVAVNEVITRFSFNRNSRKLLDNDIALAELYDSVFAGLDISTWNRTAVYAHDSLVWYLH